MTFKSPLHVLHDSGAPEGSTDYTTVVILHGYAWHSGIFERLLPFARPHNARVLLVNRRDYPGAKAYTDAERALLPDGAAGASTPTAKEDVAAFVQARARELHDLLVELVRSDSVQRADRAKNTGGIVVAGWSLGTVWATALLAHVRSYPVGELGLGEHLRRVVFLDPPYHCMGYPPPETPLYNPLFDTELAPAERERAFTNWVSGYYDHGPTVETLERRTPLAEPPPTLSTLSAEDVGRTLWLPPGAPEGSDRALLDAGIALGVFADLRKAALFPTREDDVDDCPWRGVEVRYVTCERSVCEMPWATVMLERELEAARAEGGVRIRNVRVVHVRGGNHFVQWDQPELALRALVGEGGVVA